MTMIDKICREEANSFMQFEPDIIKPLQTPPSLLYVTVYADDRFKGDNKLIDLNNRITENKTQVISLLDSYSCTHICIKVRVEVEQSHNKLH